MSGQSFKHSGKIGDLIYSLPLVEQLGGGALYLCPNEFLSFSVETCRWLLPLLEEQPYIDEVKIWNDEPEDWDLDRFRYDPFTWRTNIVKQHFDAFKVEQERPSDPWLTVFAGKSHGKAVFSRSLRRTQIPGFWQFFRNLFPDAIFVGTRKEHEAIECIIGPIDHMETDDALELAKVIAGASCLVGNQSGPYAFAEGLKIPTIQEVDPKCPNCVFDRPNVYYVSSPSQLKSFSQDRWDKGNAGEIGVALPAIIDPDPNIGCLGAHASKRCSIIIVTYNSTSTLKACLGSVLATMTSQDEVILVDNASSDGTQAMLEAYGDLPYCKVSLSDTNLGFSAASNVGIKMSKGEFICLLNPDTEVPPHWLEKLSSRFQDPEVGAVGPASNRVAGYQFVGCHLPEKDQTGLSKQQLFKRLDDLHPGQSMSTKLLVGFCIMFRRDVLNKVGLLDEAMFLGSEDLEISWRLREYGYLLLIAVDTFVWHDAAGQSFQSLEKSQAQQWLDQSTEVLKDKLAKAYSPPAKVTALELWGVDFW